MFGRLLGRAGRAAGQRARGRSRGRGRGRAGRGNQGGMLANARAVRGGPRPQRGRGRFRGMGRGRNAMRAQRQASNRAGIGAALPALFGANKSAGAAGPRRFNPSRPVNARLLGGVGPSRAVNPAARQRQLQGMGNLQRPRLMNPRFARGGLFGRPASRRPATTPMGNTYFGGNRGAPRGPQMARRGRGRGLFG